jgi:hypothetical protein
VPGSRRIHVAIFVVCFVLFAGFSGKRLLQQSAAPHFVLQAMAWMEGRLDLDPRSLPNLEDWACAREAGLEKVRCRPPLLSSDRWYVSFPLFPAVVMLPFVMVNGARFNDTWFTVLVASLSVVLFFALLRFLAHRGETGRGTLDDLLLALTLAFGSLFFSSAIRGEVWFTAEVMGVGLTSLYLRAAVGARRPWAAGFLYSMAALTRAPLLVTVVFFWLEVICPGPEGRLGQVRAFLRSPKPGLAKLGAFALGALPIATLAGAVNWARFGRVTEFGHAFLYENRVNADVDAHGLFSLSYLWRNVQAAFLRLPLVELNPLHVDYDPHGLSLLLTLPFLALLFWPREKRRLQFPLWCTVAACGLPGLLYQNDGYMQFGFRFSLDYTPYLVLLLAVSGWSLRNRAVLALLAIGVLVNTWGAAAFHGYTELLRHW